MASLAFLYINGKNIIQTDSENLVNLFEGVMYSELLQNVASDILERSSKKHNLRNPYHPKNNLILNNLKTGVVKGKKHVKTTPVSSNFEDTTESLEELNDVESDDILNDADEDMKPTYQIIDIHNLKIVTLNSVANSIAYSTAYSITNSTVNSTEPSILEHKNIKSQKKKLIVAV